MKKSPYTQITVSIDRISSKGFGSAVWQKPNSSLVSKVVIPGALPEDVIVAEIGPKQKDGYTGRLLEVITPSPDRVPPPCPHVPLCGGCSLQALAYEKQLEYKEQLVKQAFAPLFSGEVAPIIPSETVWRYRNKMEYTFSQNKEGEKFLGLIRAASKGRVESLRECHLSPVWFTTFLQEVHQWWRDSSLMAYNPFKNTGSLRTLTLREGKNTGDKMVFLTVSGVPEFSLSKLQIDSFADVTKRCLEGNVSVFLRIQQSILGRETQFYEMQLSGMAHIEEKLKICVGDYKREYRFKISPTAFFQPNTSQAERLYAKALEMVGLTQKKRVLDLYAGTATLGMVFAPFAEKVVSIEINPYAVFDAEMNQEINEVNNLSIIKGDVAEVLQDLKKQDSSFYKTDLAVVDPPRTGLSQQALAILIELRPEKILYISCAPRTQAKDCSILQEAGYRILAIQPLDQFAHTVHIENIVLLSV